jgi:Flp pilus assembly protein TadD
MKSKRSAHSISKVIAHVGLAVAVSACSTLFPGQSGPQVKVPDLNDPVQRSASLLRYCTKMHQKGDLSLAAGICNRAHEIDPTNPAPLMELASVLQDLGMAASAAEAYRAALLLNPQQVDALYGLGKLYIDRQHYDLAMEPLETAVLFETEDPRIYNALGVIMDQQDNHASAQSYYRQGLAYSPRNVSLRNNLGLSLVLNGQDSEGLAMLREVAAEPEAGATAGRNLEMATQIAAQARGGTPIASNPQPAKAVDDEPVQPTPLSAAPAQPAYLSSMTSAGTIPPQSVPLPEAVDDRPTGTPVPLLQHYEQSAASPFTETATGTAEDHLSGNESAAAYTPPPRGSFAIAESRIPQVDATAEATPRSGPAAATVAAKPAAEQPAETATEHGQPIAAPQRTRPAKPEVAEAAVIEPEVAETDVAETEVAEAAAAEPEVAEEAAPRNTPAPQIEARLTETEARHASRATVPHTTDRHATNGVALQNASTDLSLQVAGASPAAAPQVDSAAAPPVSEMADDDWFYTVQVGSFLSAKRARLGWTILRDAAGETLAELDALIVRADLGIEMGIVYRVRTAPMESKSVAAQLCQRLMDQGIDCWPVQANRKTTAEGLVDKICQEASTGAFCRPSQNSQAGNQAHAS